MSTFTGRFYFKLTNSKNLIGEFSNDHSTCKRTYTESANLDPDDKEIKNEDKKPFIGTYYTTWCEDIKGHVAHLSKLQIKPKHNDIFSLEWWRVDSNGKVVGNDPWFKGEGMLCDGVLIGNYCDYP